MLDVFLKLKLAETKVIYDFLYILGERHFEIGVKLIV